MPISWNEIRQRATAFAREWDSEQRESAERQTFWNEFFHVFGLRRRAVASFEEPVRKLSGSWGSIDLFWPGKLIVEHKSAGENLSKAHAQAMDYIRGLISSGRSREVPRFIVVSDFHRIALHDLEAELGPDAPESSIEFTLDSLHKNVRHFAFIAGYTQQKLDPEDPANLAATELMCSLHDALEEGGYTGHELKQFLVRVLFCLFAEDTGIFPPRAFELYLIDKTSEDGSDLGVRLEQLFRVLDTPVERRQARLDEDLAQFPYVNGALFAEKLEFADFNSAMRQSLLDCCRFRWESISPAVFGSLFQAVMEPKERRQVGAHYTSEQNIMKLVRSLFLDDLTAELDRIKNLKVGRAQRLKDFQKRLASLRFLDPACGCGNFLVITYTQLRRLELDLLRALFEGQTAMELDEANRLSQLNVNQFYGIEIEEFPARIAEVALWLADHQANVELSEAFSQWVLRLPLRVSPHITVGNALTLDWGALLPAKECSFVLGNPPFIGHHWQTEAQKADQALVMRDISGAGVLDFVCNWYVKAAEYMQGEQTKCAFVSTSSISQGEQPGILWPTLFSRYGLKIHFAHRSFPWQSEARGQARVHCVIIGFGAFDIASKAITDYDADIAHPTTTSARNISPYLVAGSGSVVTVRSRPLCNVPRMLWGNKPTDGGHLILTREEKDELTSREPGAAEFIRPFMSGGDFLENEVRYCLWLANADPRKLRRLPLVAARISAVADFRRASKAASTRAFAAYPTLFRQISQPDSNYLAIPEVSSERRTYIPIAFLRKDVICSNKIQFVPNASHYHFGVLTSAMHMAWVRQVAGRLESRISYSNSLVYNNFPWPSADESQQKAIAEAARNVLECRASFSDASLADLYAPGTMPAALTRAHATLDRLVDRAYRREAFPSERSRFEHLFSLYEGMLTPLLTAPRARRARRS